MSKYTEKLGTEGERVILLAQDPDDPTKYVPVKAVANGDETYSIETSATALDITLSALRDALKGTGDKDLADIVTALTALKGIGNKDLTDVISAFTTLRNALLGADSKDLTTLQAAVTALLGAGTKDLTTLQTAIETMAGAKTLSDLWTLLNGTLNMQLTGSITTVTHSVATVGVATGAVLAANANRKYALVVNDSTSDIYFKIGAPAVMNQGILLCANGGSYEMSTALGNLMLGAINGISATAGRNVIVTEGV